ncbi:MAG TPA: alpha-glucosidase [Buttiauxella sp.]|nr:alpha-glucosidase [Buttiauxella sp.]
MKTRHWWQDSVFYQIYLPSFCDGNADGLGDFIGLEQKVDYLAELGITGVWITPFYPSPLVDNGYDISDYCAVDSRFGSMDNFRKVVAACHAKGIRVVIDLVINHVSTEHPWFKEAFNNPQSHYRDYFIFSSQPNNWQSFFSGSAWQAEPDTGQYYYHQFSPQQVDLNWANPQVEQEIFAVIDFWLAQGVDGFRFDVINFLTTDGVGPDNPEIDGQQQHENDVNQPGIEHALRRICHYVREQGDYFLIGEIGSEELPVLSRYQSPELMDVVFNFNLGSQKTFDVARLFGELQTMCKQQTGMPTLFFSSHDMPRMIGRFGETERDTPRARAVMVLQLTALGVPFIFQGDELGMSNYLPKTAEQIFDIQGKTHYQTALATGLSDSDALVRAISQSRDGSRSPLPWSTAPFSGFSCVKPWMPLNPNSLEINADTQRKQPDSLWHEYQKIIALRHASSSLRTGVYRDLGRTGNCIWYSRESEDESTWVAVNFGEPIRNPWCEINATTVAGNESEWLGKNEFIIKRSCYAKAQ